MNVLYISGSALVGFILGTPAAGVGCSVPAQGPLRLARGWVLGGSAHPIVVAVAVAFTGTATALAAHGLGRSPALPGYALTGAVAAALAIADARVRRLPHALSGLAYLLVTVSIVLDCLHTGETDGLTRALVAAVAVPLLLLAVALLLPGQLGLGDVATVGWISLALAWRSGMSLQIGLAVGMLVQATVAVGALIASGRDRARTTPMGPALIAGWLAGLAWPAGG